MTPERLAALVDAARELEAITIRIAQALRSARSADAVREDGDPPLVTPRGK